MKQVFKFICSTRSCCFMVLLLSGQSWLFAQTETTIHGTVYSKDDSLPVIGAHIRIGTGAIGAIADANGRFRLMVSDPGVEWNLVISSIGYKTLRVPMNRKMIDKEIELYLASEVIILPKTYVEDDRFAAFNLVRKAVDKIPENYDLKPVMLSAFYREYLRVFADELHRSFKNPKKDARKKKRNLDESVAYNVTEGVFSIHKYPYAGKGKNKRDEVRLIKARRIGFDPRSVQDSVVQAFTNRFKHKGGPHDLLKRDFLKDPEGVEFLKKRANRKYEYHTVGIVSYEGRGAFKVVFDQKEKINDELYKGVIYIDTASYAFLEIDFSLSPRGVDFRSLGLSLGVVSWMTGVDMNLLEFSGRMSFRHDRGKWYPEYQQYTGKLNVQMDRKVFGRRIKVDLVLDMQGDLLITGIDRLHVRQFKGKEEFKDSDAIDDFVGEYHDPFWQHHQYTLSSEHLIEKMKREEKTGQE